MINIPVARRCCLTRSMTSAVITSCHSSTSLSGAFMSPWRTPLVACLVLLSTLSSRATAQSAGQEKPKKLYELRLYTAAEGKLPELHARFRDHTMKLFEKHGMENVIYWTVSEGTRQDDAKNMLVYIIAHKDKADADASWAAFRAEDRKSVV